MGARDSPSCFVTKVGVKRGRVLELVVDRGLDRVCASCRRAASMRRLGLLSGSACDSPIQLFLAPSTGETASVSSRLEPVETDHRADDDSDIHDESGNRVHAIGRALRSAALHARDRFSKNVRPSAASTRSPICRPRDRLRQLAHSTTAIYTRRDAGDAPKCRRKVTRSAKSN